MEKTICGGKVTYTVNKPANSVTAKLEGVKAGDLCKSCMWRVFCNKITPNSDKLVTVIAFSGMVIGALPITNETKTTIEVTTAKGQKLRFDKKTGIQVNAKNKSFANRIEIN